MRPRLYLKVDSFDAMVSERPYRDRRSARAVLETLKSEQYEGQWDTELLGYFTKMMNPLVDTFYK